MASAGKFSCEGCGKQYTWKPELAGRRVKCKCAHVMTVPAEDPVQTEAPPEGFEDLYALSESGPVAAEAVTPPPIARGTPCPSCGASMPDGAVVCVSCGHNVKSGKKLKKAKSNGGGGGSGGGGGGGMATPALAGAGGGGASSALLGYASMAPRRRPEADAHGTGDIFIHPLKDLYIPAGMIVLGTIFSFIVMTVFYNLHAGTAMLSVGVLTIINVALTVPAVMITVKMFDLGLGPIGPGLLKIAACAVAPGALGDLIGKVIIGGGIGSYIGWTIAYIATIIIFMKLLEMDFFEMNVCSVIIFLIQAFVGYALLWAILNGLGVSGLPVGGFGMGGTGGGGRVMLSGEEEHDEDDGLDSIRGRQSDDRSVSALLRGGIEAKEWMQKSPEGILAKRTHDQSIRILRGIYDAGALEIRVYPDKNAKNVDSVNYFIISPPRPDAPNAKPVRDRIIKELKVLAKDLGRAIPRDRGEKYFPVRMLSGEEEDKELNIPITPGPDSTPGRKPANDDDDDDN